ncbi:Tubulin binding cofactor A [Kalmanozyma brasiliensis GHG001]|uniref:Tubulin-specific chaperone A n=1 Tax=Kalmanozyma brasiliensis (strain GHG001) TaxID=1365824 RepID=V5ET17_KALBG|nr:Tubulin binding cofactor A [Kalmanozyma brasiliensis GHG001]EST06143.1 Tubulin binding cofactor A [Kalmanozyma brasiliensis GHG001]
MADSATTKRQLQIKTGVVKRLAKEESSYLTEAQQQEARIQKFVDDGRDEYDVKQQRTVLSDTLKMIPDCRKRLEIAADDLSSYVDGLEDDASITTTDEFIAAKNILTDVQEQLSSPLPSV